ncbi:MAG: histidinol-phosphatase [Muribaculaceae bacterium]
MFDFNKICAQFTLYNFHSHTQFCDGHACMEDFVKEAISENFTHYGFSPHSPIPFESPCNMNNDDVTSYFDEVNRLKNEYGSKINLYGAMEIDYIDENWGPSSHYFETLPLDYKIGSVHFIPSDNEYVDIDGRFESFKIKMDKYFNNDIKSVVEGFYSQSIKMIEAGGFDIIGHFDKIGHNAGHFRQGIEKEPWYEVLVLRTLDAIKERKLIVEINTKAWDDHNRFFPNQRYFDLLKKYEVPLLINSDAHFPLLINSGRDDAMNLLNPNL